MILKIPVNIYDLGLYKIEFLPNKKVNIDDPHITLIAQLLKAPKSVKNNILKIEGVSDCEFKISLDPPLGIKQKCQEAAKAD